MAAQAQVTSLDALETLRAHLIVFLSKARRCADDAGDEVRRTRLWLQHDQRMHWENAVKRARKALDQAEAELFSAKLSGLRETTAAQQNAVLKAKRALELSESKLRKVKTWNRDFDSAADPLVKRLEGLRQFLDFELPKAITYLVQALRTLEDYAQSAPLSAPAPAADTAGTLPE